ncbi:MAG TPA: response regulator, partial [Lacunisphaera sp.]|nr:response regulator [Lacunisphaera sp.]
GDFAAIVLDVQMPTMNGIELANLIKQRKRTQHIPIIFLTAYLQEDKDVLEGYSMGAVDYLTKPINPQILKSKIGVFVDLFRKTHALAAANSALELEVAQRQTAEKALQAANDELEARVQARTADLVRVNEELRNREAALRASEAQAMAASRAKDSFLAALSHELRTPLNPVLLLATEAARNPHLSAEVRTDFETIAQNVTLEARLIDDLLDLTSIERGKLSLNLQPCQVHDILRKALALVQADIEEKGLRLSLRLNAGKCVVRGDEVRLKQVCWNVLRNAAKFTPNGGEITVETAVRQDTSSVIIRITDTGIGMTAPELARIFQAFAQGDHADQNSSASRFGGLGLGLAISRRMVELHTGSITATSAGRNQGTTLLITLPVLQATADTPPAVSEPSPLPLFELPADLHCRVLLVEDHKSTAVVLANLLTARRYDVLSAGSVTEARGIAEREPFDVLISDIGLPDGDGYQLMTELRSKRPQLVGIALTGYGMEGDVSRSHEAGFTTHLTKPINVRALETALGLLNGRQAQLAAAAPITPPDRGQP